MKTLSVIQHTSADYLGLMEDHLEGRRIRFKYCRPFTEDGKIPAGTEMEDGLVLLGGGPWGSVGERIVPTLAEEIALAKAYYMNGLPIIGIGLGAQILALAADGGAEPAAINFSVEDAQRIDDNALNGFLPETYPNPVYMRDRPIPPSFAKTLAVDSHGQPALFQIGTNMFGFTGHPGFKRAMAEDLVMEFEEGPENPGSALDLMTSRKKEIEDALVQTMTGLIQLTQLMQP
ncbi:MAG: glutamine amidotransferase-related protein [bacterium]